jgi:hypothetical protein
MGTAFVVFFSKDLKALDTLDFWVGTFLIFILATIQIVVFSWVFGARRGLEKAAMGAVFKIPPAFLPIMTFVCPVFLIGIFVLWVLVNVFGFSFSGGEPEISGYVKDLFVTPDPVAWMSMALVGIFGAFVTLLVARASAYQTKPTDHAEVKS